MIMFKLLAVSVLCSALTFCATAQDVWFGGPFKVGATPQKELPEASGMVASTTNPDVLWMHNDSGDEPTLYAVTLKGGVMEKFTLPKATARDWEDMAYGPGPEPGKMYLYAGDIGDNEGKRQNITVYRLPEPDLSRKKSDRTTQSLTYDTFTFTYPDGARDAEALIVDPLTQDMYIVSKRDKKCRIYRAAAPHVSGTTRKLEFVTALPMNLFTAGDISHDGSQILLKNYLYVWHWTRNGKEPLTETFKREATRITYMPEEQGEAICFTPKDDGFYTTSEREEGGDTAPIYFYPRVKSAREVSTTRDAKIPQISVTPSEDTPGIYNLRYVIPEVSRVTVTVHNSIMIKILDVATESGESGVQEREIDLIDQPSGTYVAVVKTNGVTVMCPIEHLAR
ncbi:MAG: hypothetical protein IPH49_09540 [Ignavibacteria bacterium]|nr:hypothetical protein [Ignavibacteria bacterium]